MPDNKDLKSAIQTALSAFESQPLAEAARGLLNTLGYRSNKTLKIAPNSYTQFQSMFDPHKLMTSDAMLNEWVSVDLLFQVTGDELGEAFSHQTTFFASQKFENIVIESYLFFAIELTGKNYSRKALAGITREVNKCFKMPVLIIFKHGKMLTFSIIARRVNKKDDSRDVLEKVTLIKDIRFTGNRPHVEILHDLALSELTQTHPIANFVDLQKAWEKTLDINELNKKFYKEIANWYFWAVKTVKFPKDAEKDEATRNATSVIRLITRLIFVWFIKEKGLVPEDLFDPRRLNEILDFADPKKSTYYKAILQNLFFATLNTEMGAGRMFRRKNTGGLDPDYLMSNYYRYKHYFKNPEKALEIFAGIPFLNGGLFECLDKEIEKGNVIRVDGFSDRDDNPLQVPDDLFLMEREKEIDLNEIYDTKNKKYKVRGLIHIFNSYKFTIEENTPIEEEIALDPELLGKVFENLLAAYNPETGTTARKQTGSFYTPREIVNYMVDEALIAYLESALLPPFSHSENGGMSEGQGGRLRALLSYNPAVPDFTEAEKTRLIAAIDNINVLDPACGSGAFPMGVLHKLVFMLGKLDPKNERWKQKQISKVMELESIDSREASVRSIEQVFAENHDDYGRKLYLIENCIYGVDIQPIAVQIAKLRFFISLVVDQKTNAKKPNLGIRPLPNLETKFVAANTLIGIQRPDSKSENEAPASASIPPEVEEACEMLIRKLEQFLKSRNPDLRARYVQEAQEFADVINAGMGADFQPLVVDWVFSTAKDTAALKVLLPVRREAKASPMVLRNQQIEEKEKELERVRREHFSARTPATKRKYRDLDKKLRLEIADLLSKNHALEDETAQQLAGWDPYNQNAHADFFDPEWMFGIEGGFDVVIGNPPYVGHKGGQKDLFNKLRKTSLGERFNNERMDLFYYFFHVAFDIAKQNGIITFITTNYFVTADSAIKLRKDLQLRTTALSLINFNELKIFESALGQHNLISVFRKALQINHLCKVSVTKRVDAATHEILNGILLESDEETTYRLIPNSQLYEGNMLYITSVNATQKNAAGMESILDKLKENSIPLGDLCHISQGIVTGIDKITPKHIRKGKTPQSYLGAGCYVLNQNEYKQLKQGAGDIIKPWFKNSDVNRYLANDKNDEWLIWATFDLDMENYEKVYAHLVKLSPAIKARNYDSGELSKAKKMGKWWALSSSRKDFDFTKPKIVSPQRSYENTFGYTEAPWYASADVYFITQSNPEISLKYILALLNSKLYFRWLYFKGKRKGEMLELYLQPLSDIPIKTISVEKQNQFIHKTDKILAAKRADPQADTRELESQIDELVYQLYGLTEEEVKIVEERA